MSGIGGLRVITGQGGDSDERVPSPTPGEEAPRTAHAIAQLEQLVNTTVDSLAALTGMSVERVACLVATMALGHALAEGSK